MEAILFGILMALLGFSMFFAKDFWWGIQDLTNLTRGLVSKRTEMWEIGMIFSGTITVLFGFVFMYFGMQLHEIRSQPVIPFICNEPDSNLSNKSEVRGAIKIGCAAAQKKDYEKAKLNFLKASDEYESEFRGQNLQEYYYINRSSLEAAIRQMDKQLKN